jgi:hypothetical protein
MSGRLWLVLAFALVALSCGPVQPSGQPPADTADKNPDAWPSEAEVRKYLDGKTLTLPAEPGDGGKQWPPITIRKANIVAPEVNKSGVRGAGDPWSTSATLIYDVLGTKYAIEVRVSHREVAGKRAFFGLEVTRAAKQ